MAEQRTDEEIQRLSEEAFRHEINPETERLRMLQEAREEIRKACHKLADPYDQLANGQWAEQGVSLGALVENVVSDLLAERGNVQRMRAEIKRLTQEVADEKYRKVRALGRVSCLEIDVKNAYREIEKLKGGE